MRPRENSIQLMNVGSGKRSAPRTIRALTPAAFSVNEWVTLIVNNCYKNGTINLVYEL